MLYDESGYFLATGTGTYRMPPQLMALTDGPNILLEKPIVLIGRHQECDIQIPSRKISRRHCCIAQVNDHLVVRDLGSTNGVRVNGARVLEGTLKSGDELVIGNFKYQVRIQGASPNPPPPVPPSAEPVMRPLASPYDSFEEPVPLAEPAPEEVNPLGPMVPTNKSNPPGSKPLSSPFEVSREVDIPLAIMPESMSLEPLSEDYQQLKKGKGPEKK